LNLKISFKYLLLFPAVFIFYSSKGQNFATHLYTTADGLSDNYILSVYQDSYGYLWIGTANGLNRFDGKRFINFGLAQGLPSLSVDKIYEDHNHRLWIGTRNGIAELKGDSCYSYPVNDKQQISFVSGFIEPEPSKLWATTNKGLYELQNDHWEKITLDKGFENASIGKIIKVGKSLYINYQYNKLLQHTSDDKQNLLMSVETSHPYYNSLLNIGEKIYIGTYSSLLQWKENKWMPLLADSLHKRFIYISYHDSNNRWWFGTKEDGILLATANGQQFEYTHIPLSFNLVSNFFEDKDHNIWAACFHGLLKISPSYYQTISLPPFDNMHFIHNSIGLPSGNIVVSGQNGKLVIIKPINKGETPTQILSSIQLKNPIDFIDHYTFDEQERMLFTTREGKLYRLAGDKLRDLSSIVHHENRVLRDLAYNKKTKQLFVCGDSVLLFGNEDHLDTFFSPKKEFIFQPEVIHLEEQHGSMLVQTLSGGSFLINEDEEINPLDKDLNFSVSVKNKNDNSIWAAYRGKGISKYKWSPNQAPQLMETITEADGLPSNYILNLTVDEQGKLWIATTKGITLMKRDQQGKWIHEDLSFDQAGNPGLLSFAKINPDVNGNLWMNLKNKLVVFDPQKLPIKNLFTNTIIEKILLFDKPAEWTTLTDSFEGYHRLPVDPVLKYNQNTISIFFNALQFNDNSQLEYSYRLLPSDPGWSEPSTGNVVSFYQLNPGQYNFEVKSHIKGFDWSSPATFSFIIKKPFWETWWFRLTLIAVATALIIFIFRYRLMQLKTRTEMQNKLRELDMKALKLQMNPHFIHNALNSIQSLVLNNRTNEASHYISKFAKLLRQVLENSDKDLVPLDKELYSLQLYLDLEKLRMNMDVDYSVHIDDSVVDSEIKIPPLILQPFVENALWHGLGNKEGEKKILLNIHSKPGWVICEITDNGIGRKKAASLNEIFPEGHLSKAVDIIRQRLSDFNQSSDTEPVSFIDLEENGQAMGTTVIIRLKNPG